MKWGALYHPKAGRAWVHSLFFAYEAIDRVRTTNGDIFGRYFSRIGGAEKICLGYGST